MKIFSSTFTGKEFFLQDHQVNGEKVLPGVAYLEMVQAAVREAVGELADASVVQLQNIIWSQSMVVCNDFQSLHISLSPNEAGAIDYSVYTTDEKTAEPIIYSKGIATLTTAKKMDGLSVLNLANLQTRMQPVHKEMADYYVSFQTLGIDYGPSFQGLEAILTSKDEVLAKLQLPDSVADTQNDFVLHPSLMDTALQASIGLSDTDSLQLSLPFALDTLDIVSACTSTMWAWIRYTPGYSASDTVQKLDIDLCDELGNVNVRLRGFTTRMLGESSSAHSLERIGTLMAKPVWKEQPIKSIEAFKENKKHYVFFFGFGTIIKDLEEKLSTSICVDIMPSSTLLVDGFEECALQLFSYLKKIIKEKLKHPVFIQVLIPNSGKSRIYRALSSLLKTAELENPKIISQLLMVDVAESINGIVEILKNNSQVPEDKQVCYEFDKRRVHALTEVPARAEVPVDLWKEKGVYLITGGLGGLGLIFARSIAQKTVQATLILTGRSKLNKGKQQQLEVLRALGVIVDYQQVDVTDQQAVNALMESIQKTYGHLNGVLHSAGIIADNFILKKSKKEFRTVLSSKVSGTVNLDEASKAMNIDVFILFSSASGVMGNVGQADYAAANAFMDAYAHYRNDLVADQQRQGKTLSINWPLWKEGGMSLDAASEKAMLLATGVTSLSTEDGIDALMHGLSSGETQVMVMAGELARLSNLINNIPRENNVTAEPDITSLSNGEDPKELNEELFITKVIAYLKEQLAEVFKLPAHRIQAEEPLERYGINSIMVMQLTDELEKVFGSLSKTLFFEYQTLKELSTYFIDSHKSQLLTLLNIGEEQPAASTITPKTLDNIKVNTLDKNQQTPVRSDEISAAAKKSVSVDSFDIAIIGLSGRYPESEDIEVYWKNLQDGKDCVTEVPLERWNWRDYYSEDRDQPGQHGSKWGGFINDVDKFDPQFFNISPREARLMDPQERLILEHTWIAMEDAGYKRETLRGDFDSGLSGQVGVYIGMMYSEYQLLGLELDRPTLANNSYASIANRISYFFNLHGPSMVVDTMCSSSLTSIHLACQDLILQRTDLGVAGGVNVSIHPNKYLGLTEGKFISNKGRCESFGEGGEGYIPGEGVGVVLLKRLCDAEQDQDIIYGVIKGSAVNHGGKTNGYTVPNPKAQEAVISRVLKDANVNPRTISYIEAHGTGTKLGDPIEIRGLSKAFGLDVSEKQYCAIGSVKSNIGHCESAAGIAGLTKVLLQMKHKQLVPSLHSKVLNPNIKFVDTPFEVNQTLRAWQPSVVDGKTYPRIAGVSSFGAGGSNAHIIIEEYIDNRVSSETTSPQLIVLSAQTKDRLKATVSNFVEYLSKDNTQASLFLGDIAYTLQVGREAMEERLALVVSSIDELQEKLKRFLSDEKNIIDVYRDQVKPNKESLLEFTTDKERQEIVSQWMSLGEYQKLLDLWVKGLVVDWHVLYGQNKPKRISLPTYPFAKERHWITESRGATSKNNGGLSLIRETFLNDKFNDSVAIQRSKLQAKGNTQPLYYTKSSKPKNIMLNPLSKIQGTVVTAENNSRRTIALNKKINNELDVKNSSQSVVIEKSKYSDQRLERELKISLANALYLEPDAIDASKLFIDMGLDSIVSAEWVRAVNQQYGLSLTTDKVYEYPTVDEFVEYLKEELDKNMDNDLLSTGHESINQPNYEATKTVGISSIRNNKTIAEKSIGSIKSSISKYKVEVLEKELKLSLADALYMNSDDVDADKLFVDMGLDSIVGVEWIQAINKLYELSLTADTIYEYPTINEFSTFLKKELEGGLIESIKNSEIIDRSENHLKIQQSELNKNAQRSLNDLSKQADQLAQLNLFDVAIIGVSGKYPEADNLDIYWENLRSGKDCISEIPPERWDWKDYYTEDRNQSGGHHSKWGGFISDIDQFDPLFFNISPSEAELIDPQERLFLETVWNLLEGAGHTRDNLRTAYQSRVGVYVGSMYQQYPPADDSVNTAAMTFPSYSAIANRVSYFFDLRGPSIAIDTMCSASLNAIHMAYQDLIRGNCRLAIAGGINLSIDPQKYSGLSQSQMIGSHQNSRSFSNGDGFLPAEGVGAVLLKPLEAAIKDRDSILAVIKSTASNHSGRSNGYMSPNPKSQVELIEDNFKNSGIDPRTISYVESAANGSALSDTIEVNALIKVFSQNTQDKGFCAIGSVKSNIGHAEAASGISQLTKVILQLQHKQLVPTIKAEPLNPDLNFNNSPFFLQQELEEWKRPCITIDGVEKTYPLRAGISSFGAGGSNVHVIVEEYDDDFTGQPEFLENDSPRLIVLSAKTEKQLHSIANNILDYLKDKEEITGVDLLNIAYTLQEGREAMEERLAFIVNSKEQLLDRLQDFLENKNLDNAYRGQVRKNKKTLAVFSADDELQEAIAKWVRRGKYYKLLDLWVKGLVFDWSGLYVNVKPHRVNLPTYPFAKQRYWIGCSKSNDFKQPQEVEVPPPLEQEPVSSQPNNTADSSELFSKLKNITLREIAKQLKTNVADLDADIELGEYGFDSISLTELANQLNHLYKLTLTPAVFFEYRTVETLSEYLIKEYKECFIDAFSLSTKVQPVVENITPVAVESANTKQPIDHKPRRRFTNNTPAALPAVNTSNSIAIVGISGKFPQANDLDAFWESLKTGKDCITEIPADRWDWQALYGDPHNEFNKTNIKWGGFIEGVAEFDSLFFGISPREAKLMDPQQRLLMTYVWKTIEDAGYSPASLSGTQTGIFIGTASSGYSELATQANMPIEGYSSTGMSPSVGPNRMSYLLNLHGPSEPIETACSSSLVAIHRAIQAMETGNCEAAIVGGVNTIVSPDMYISFNKAGMLCEDGRCKTFSEQANGYVRGEGVGMLFLKRLAQAEQDGDHIYAVIKGSAENHGGRASSLTAPNPQAQAELLKTAYQKAGIDPRTVNYIEAHGTGTALGDPIEINGLKSAFNDLYEQTGDTTISEAHCGLGSVKSNIGHLELAAGVAGVIKVLLQIKHKTRVKSLHCDTINPYIELADSPFYIVQETEEWQSLKDGQGNVLPRRAGVSSFGFGGVNAHIVLEEYIDNDEVENIQDTSPQLIILSAKTDDRLKAVASQLKNYLGQEKSQPIASLDDIAYTLQVGRDAMEERLAFIIHSKGELIEKLHDFLENEEATDIYRGQVKKNKEALVAFMADEELQEAISKWVQRGKYHKLLNFWVKGLVFDWYSLHTGKTLRRVSLPTYPFTKERLWIDNHQEKNSLKKQSANHYELKRQAKINAPLNLKNTSNKPKNITLGVLSSTNSITDFSISNQPILPGKLTTINNELPIKKQSVSDVSFISKKSLEDCQKELRESLATALYLDPVVIDVDKTFIDIGLDSIVGVEWIRTINSTYGVNITANKIYDYPTIREFSGFFESELALCSSKLVENTTSQSKCLSEEQVLPELNVFNSSLLSIENLQRELSISLANALFIDVDSIEIDKSFSDVGLDSIVGVEWVRFINKKYKLNIATTVIYDYQNINLLSSFLYKNIAENYHGNDGCNLNKAALIPSTKNRDNYIKSEGYDDKGPAALNDTPEKASYDLNKAYGLVCSTVHSFGELSLSKWQVEEPAFDEVTIQVKASAINFPDTMCVNGLYPTMPEYPFVPGFEVSGIVSKVGSDVLDIAVGDEVVALTGDKMGGHASEVNVSTASLIHKPKNISFEEACSLPVAFSTIYYAFELGKLSYKDHVLIQTATGGCGLMAMQLANLKHCVCYATSSRSKKLDILKTLGISNPINYKTSKFDQEIKQLTNNRGVDVVLNMLSGDGIQKGLNCLASSGRYLEIAVQALKNTPNLDLSNLVDNQSIYSIDLRRLGLQNDGLESKRLLNTMADYLESEKIVPIVSRIYPAHQIVEALEYVSQGNHIGKVVISHTHKRMVDCEEQLVERLLIQKRKSEELSSPVKNISSVAIQQTEVFKKTVTQDIAIIGISGQFPKSETLESFWENLVEGRDCISEIPAARWPIEEYYDEEQAKPGKTYCKSMGVLHDVDQFDPLFFNISPAEAELMDPQQRLFLQNCWQCIEDSGYNPISLSGSLCGIFVGCQQGDYEERFSTDAEGVSAQNLMGSSPSILSARIAYILNLKGPCLAIDTACSSSLVAISEACNSLLLGDSDLALAGGVSVLAGPSTHIMTSHAGMLSESGRCFTFDQKANGFVPGEGAGVILLKRLVDAKRDNDHVHAIIKGWGVNQDGKTNGITAPSTRSQVDLEKRVYKRFSINPENISMVEAHGTGTKLGDPIEVSALKESFSAYTSKTNYCALGSVKSNIGHLLAASGVASVIKVILALKHQQIPPVAHYQNINEHIKLDNSPFYINTEKKAWPVQEGLKRCAAVSSFGFSGTNAHLVIEEYPAKITSNNVLERNEPYLIILSAKTEDSLKMAVRNLKTYLINNQASIHLNNIAYTLQLGRGAMEERLGLIVDNVETLRGKLEDFIEDKRGSENFFRGRSVQSNNQLIDPVIDGSDKNIKNGCLSREEANRLLGFWVKGSSIDWNKLYEYDKPQKISLPVYAFSKDRYWAEFCSDEKVNNLDNNTEVIGSDSISSDSYSYKSNRNNKPLSVITNIECGENQKRFIEKFISNYEVKTKKSKNSASYYRKCLVDQRTPIYFNQLLKDIHYPITYKKASGAYLYDIDGNKYIDIAGDFGVNLFGHNPEFLSKALKEQLDNGIALSGRYDSIGKAAEIFCEITGQDRVLFCQSGTESLMSATRLAKAFTERSKIVAFDGSYHGHSDSFLSSLIPGVNDSAVEDTIFLKYGDVKSLDSIFDLSPDIAAVIVEPVQSKNIGFQPADFLRKLREMATEKGFLLIFDEIITSFRVHQKGCQDYFGVQADLSTYGKILGGGITAGAVAGRKEIMAWADGGVWDYDDESRPKPITFLAGTHTQNPLKMAATLAVLKEIKNQSPVLQDKINKKTEFLVREVSDYIKEKHISVNVPRFASQFKFEFISDSFNLTQSLFLYLLNFHGVRYNLHGNCFLTSAHSDNDVFKIIESVKASFDILINKGFFVEEKNNYTENIKCLSSDNKHELLLGNNPEGYFSKQLLKEGNLQEPNNENVLREKLKKDLQNIFALAGENSYE